MSHLFFTGQELLQIQMDARKSLRNAYALGSFKNLAIQWVKFLHFCVYFRLIPFPASTVVLVWYAQYLSRKLKAHASIISYLSGVKMLHNLLSFSTTGFTGVLLKMTLRGLRRSNQHMVKWGAPDDTDVTQNDTQPLESSGSSSSNLLVNVYFGFPVTV